MTEPVSEEAITSLLSSLQALGNKEPMVDLAHMGPQRGTAQPYMEIVEQPKQRDHRFRYHVEGRQAGSISGEKSTPDLPTYPTVKLHNLTGRAKVVASLVTRQDPIKPHPHRLVGENCQDGVCTMKIDKHHPVAEFRKIGVQRTKNEEVEKSLEERNKAGVRLSMEINKGKSGGKKHNYDMKAVRLYFEVFIESRDESNVYDQYLKPVVSSAIYDKKDTILTISRVNINNGSVAGGEELFILCEKVQSEDIKVKFSGMDPDTGNAWSADGHFGPSDVHRQYAIVCKTPKFINQRIKAAVKVHFKLYRPSDGESSKEIDFTYKPLESFGQADIEKKKRKLSHKDDDTYNRYFTKSGKPIKTETLGASNQSCSGAPVSSPVSNAPSMLTMGTAATMGSSKAIQQNLRRQILEKDPSLANSFPDSSDLFSGSAVGQPMDCNLSVTTSTYSSEAHMSSGQVIQRPTPQQQQPSGSNLSIQDIPAQAFLLSLAMNQCPEDLEMDDERQTSEQRIQAIADDLMYSVEGGGGFGETAGADSASGVIVQREPSSMILHDVQFSTVDIAAFQEVASDRIDSDIVFASSPVDIYNMSSNNSSNASQNPLG